MSKINQVQQALLEIGDGKFQKLADAYLVERGYDRINSIGSVVGADKVKKGTPDCLFALANGRYVFAEHTTQKSGLFAKMSADLAKCFDEDKTGIPIEKIERVIFCFTSNLDARQENELAELCQKKEVNLDLFGIDAIAFDLYLKYPRLALDFLGIQIDTGQVVPPDQFVSLYNNNKLATRLDLPFHFREDEINKVLDALDVERLVILSGRPGIGKSRLALEACKRFQETHIDFEVMCIFKRDRDLWEDLQTHFRRTGNFLIFVDDANRISRFEYVIDLLQHQRQDQGIKIIATVRDYALSRIRDAARPLGGGVEFELGPLTEKQIKDLIKSEYDINNFHYLERIANIAQGNPRLAVMAAEVAKGNSLNSIYDVSALYDHYFSSIHEDLHSSDTDLERTIFLKVAAIVSFYKAVDRSNAQMMDDIKSAFDIESGIFWESVHQLHKMEILDLHEDEVVRISDQVLATYLFYLAVFKEKVLNFGIFLQHFFPKLRHQLIDSINPILSAFDSERIIEAMRPHFEATWSRLKNESNTEGTLHLLDVFWFVKRTDTLVWVKEQVAALDTEAVNIEEIKFEKSSNAVPSPSLLSILKSFAYAEVEEAYIGLDLLLQYITKRPAEAPLLVRILIENYGFQIDSYLRRYEVQHAVVDVLLKWATNESQLFARIFLVVASDYLNTHFDSHSMKGRRMVQITRFDPPATKELDFLREKIWKHLFALYKSTDFQGEVFNLIHQYSTSRNKVRNGDVVKSDSIHLLPFLASVLNALSYQHCVVMNDYLGLLSRHGIEFQKDLRNQFNNDTYALSQILLSQWSECRTLELPFEEYEKFKFNQLKEYTIDYTLDDYTHFFEGCLEIRAAFGTSRDDYLLQGRVVNILLVLADRNPGLYLQVLEHYLSHGDPLSLPGEWLVQKLMGQLGEDKALQFLSKLRYPTQIRWLFHFHEVLPEDAVNEEYLRHLYGLYETATHVDLPYRMDFILKYIPIDSRAVVKIVSIVLKKAETTQGYASSLAMMFNTHTKIAKRLIELFSEDLDLFKQAYLVAEGAKLHNDYSGEIFNCLLDLDPTFMTRYIDWKYSNAERGWLCRDDDTRNYSFIWDRRDYHEIMERVVVCTYIHERESYTSPHSYIMTFFGHEDGSELKKEETIEKQNILLLALIDERNKDTDFMDYLFGVTAEFQPERKVLFIENFVQRNPNFDAFERIALEPNTWSSNGSWVPVLQERVDFWKSLLRIMNSVELLQHKQYIERQVQELNSRIEQEKKIDFMGD